LIGSIEPEAAIRTTPENAIIALRSFRISRRPFASNQTEHDFFRHSYVFRALDDRPTVLLWAQAATGLTHSGYARKKRVSSLAQSLQQFSLVDLRAARCEWTGAHG
jgi:hypothetical protein